MYRTRYQTRPGCVSIIVWDHRLLFPTIGDRFLSLININIISISINFFRCRFNMLLRLLQLSNDWQQQNCAKIALSNGCEYSPHFWRKQRTGIMKTDNFLGHTRKHILSLSGCLAKSCERTQWNTHTWFSAQKPVHVAFQEINENIDQITVTNGISR